jgi:hypothetical protein
MSETKLKSMEEVSANKEGNTKTLVGLQSLFRRQKNQQCDCGHDGKMRYMVVIFHQMFAETNR